MDSNLDILFFAIVAIFFFARLWSLLGRQDHSDDKKLPPLQNPFAQPPQEKKQDDVLVFPGKAREVSPQALITEHGFATASLAGSLDRLRSIDSSFDEKQFIEGAKVAFRMIVDAFAKGDLAPVERLLSPSVLASFKEAVPPDASPATKPRVEQVTEALLTAVLLDEKEARLTVNFTSLQNPAGALGQTIEIHDRWIFSRAFGAANPNWILAATSA